MAHTRGMVEIGGLVAAVGVGGVAAVALLPGVLTVGSASLAGVGLLALAGLVGGVSLRRRPGHHGDASSAAADRTTAYSYASTGEC